MNTPPTPPVPLVLICSCGELWKVKYYGITCPNCGKVNERQAEPVKPCQQPCTPRCFFCTNYQRTANEPPDRLTNDHNTACGAGALEAR